MHVSTVQGLPPEFPLASSSPRIVHCLSGSSWLASRDRLPPPEGAGTASDTVVVLLSLRGSALEHCHLLAIQSPRSVFQDGRQRSTSQASRKQRSSAPAPRALQAEAPDAAQSHANQPGCMRHQAPRSTHRSRHARHQNARSSGCPSEARDVSGLFKSPVGVLLTFPSRYLSPSTRLPIFSLGRRSSPTFRLWYHTVLLVDTQR